MVQTTENHQNEQHLQESFVLTTPQSPTSSGFLFARHVSPDGQVTPVAFNSLARFTSSMSVQKLDTLDDVEQRNQSTGYLWLHLDRRDKNVINWLRHEPFFDETVVETLTADDSRPRTIAHHQGVLLNLRGVNLNPQRKPEDMLPVRLWIHDHVVISMQIEKLRSIDDLLVQIDNQDPPLTQAELVADLTNLLLLNMESTIDRLELAVDEIERVVFKDKTINQSNNLPEPSSKNSQSIPQELSYVRRTAIMLHRFLAPQKVALNSFSHLEYGWINQTDRFRLQDVADQTARITEELTEVQERATIVHEFMSEQHIEQMNRTMLLLAIVSVVFIPMGLISGIMGMNVGGIPLTENTLGFLLVLAALALTGLFTVLALKRFKLF